MSEDKILNETYEQWCDRLTGKNRPPLEQFRNTEYTQFKTAHAMVMDEVESKFGHHKWYQEYKPAILRMIGDSVAMTIYIKERMVAEQKRKEEYEKKFTPTP